MTVLRYTKPMRNAATDICQTLQNAGHEAFFVGGAVRDQLLGIVPKDYDIATNATPDQVAQLFERTQPVGKAFGVVLVRHGGYWTEVATYRTESDYTDGRRPKTVHFSTLQADADRRDFTINAMYFDPISRQLVDPHGGQSDLSRGVLRFIGDAETRVREDHLRLLRAVRFAARFDLEYIPETKTAVEQHASLINLTAAERVGSEISAMLTNENRSRAMADLAAFGLMDNVLPELEPLQQTPQPHDHHSEGSVWNHTLLVLRALGDDTPPELAWAALLHDAGKTETIHHEGDTIRYPKHAEVSTKLMKQIGKRLALGSKLTTAASWLVAHHHVFDQWTEMRPSRQLHYFDHPQFASLLQLHRADIHGAIPTPPNSHDAVVKRLEEIQAAYYTAIADKRLPQHNVPILSGRDIMELLNMPERKRVGEIAKAAYDAQLEGDFTDRKGAHAWLQARIDNV